MLRLALTQTDDPDAVERACKGNWDRVEVQGSFDGTFLVVKRKDGSPKHVEPLLPAEEPVVIDLTAPRPEITKVTVYSDEAATKPVGTFQPHILADGVGPCLECGDRGGNAIRGRACPARSSGRVAEAEAFVQPKCGCDECDQRAEPGKKYCSVRCQRRQANIVRKRKGDRSPEARAAREAAATPVLEQPAAELPPEPVAPPAPRPVHCVRCDQDGHFVEDCPQPMTRRKAPVADLPVKVVASSSTPVDEPVEDASQRSVREAKERLAAAKKRDKGEGPEVITCARCHERGHSIFTCQKPIEGPKVHRIPALAATVSDEVLTAHSQTLLGLCKDGLPDGLGYTVKEDVLALYGIDLDLLDGAVRHPERVEIRPESHNKDKRYCILAFYRGDLEIIMGMRNPATPAVIAAYASSRLEHDTHRVGHTGGGGAKTGPSGLPKTSKQVATRLRAMGAEVEVDMRQKTTMVVYKEQELGQIATDGDRKTAENDYQRIQRKMAAIDRRVTA
jgi:hypothetical protein